MRTVRDMFIIVVGIILVLWLLAVAGTFDSSGKATSSGAPTTQN